MVYVFLAEGFEEIEALAFVDILRRAEIPVKTVSVNDTNAVTGSHSITVISDITADQIDTSDLDAIVLPGGMPGTLNLQASRNVKHHIEYAVSNNKLLGAICAAPMIFGNMGLLNGKNATCFPGFEQELFGAKCTGEKVVKDENIITSKGAGTTSDFAHCFITAIKDKETADKVISSMQY